MQLRGVNLTDPDIFEQGTPHEMFRILRREAPVYWHEEPDGGTGFWAVTKYHDLKYVSKNPGLFSSARQGTLRQDPSPQDLPAVQSIMLNMDPPRHRQYRTLVSQAFTPRMINNLHARVRVMVGEIIDGVVEKGECDFVEEVAALLPLRVICELIGIPAEDAPRIADRQPSRERRRYIGINFTFQFAPAKPFFPDFSLQCFQCRKLAVFRDQPADIFFRGFRFLLVALCGPGRRAICNIAAIGFTKLV
jgi:cytochrome P450